MNFTQKFDWPTFILKERSNLFRFLFPIISAGVALFLISSFYHLVGGVPLTSLAMLAVISSAIFAGRNSAFLCIFITSLGIEAIINPRQYSFFSVSNFARLFVFVLTALIISILIHVLKILLMNFKQSQQLALSEAKAKSNILTIVSHDLKSPMSSIQMNAEAALRRIEKEKLETNSTKYIKNILMICKRMNRQIADLLDSQKIDSGNFEIKKEIVSLNDILKISIEDSLQIALNKKIHINLDSTGEEIKLPCDQGRIIQVMDNLLSNAIKFSPEESDVKITIHIQSQEVIVHVQDHGPGIEKDYQNAIFEKFWQEKEFSHKGNGLGLYISRKIVESHAGKIGVNSIPGAGSDFWFSLPR